ncbi:retinoic acid receptor RXR-beta-like isoform X4 [Hyaena hyaena]|uniref:retinoic acid receptor RXR-beta-like isoform X4 n=1 Tax=Hyaena hyaena TaxID=95912 RepID=UPI00192107D0|nr:retinoic acid receptor RXR-beta-like isoform X4 [Hyaena hyaena]
MALTQAHGPRPGWSAEEADGRGRRSPRRSTSLHPACLPDGPWHLVPSAVPLPSILVPVEAPSGILHEGTSTCDPAPLGLPIPPQPQGHPAHVPAGQAGPKDSGPGPPPARRGMPSRPLLA